LAGVMGLRIVECEGDYERRLRSSWIV
jgi:hypothetical protein